MDDLAHKEMLAQTNELFFKLKAVGRDYLPDCIVPAAATYLVSTCADLGITREEMQEFCRLSIEDAYNLMDRDRISRAN